MVREEVLILIQVSSVVLEIISVGGITHDYDFHSNIKSFVKFAQKWLIYI